MKYLTLVLLFSFSTSVLAQSLPVCKTRNGTELLPSVTELKRYIDSNYSKRPIVFVEGVIKEILPEDKYGRPHQKFILNVQGIKVQVVHGTDYGRIPLRTGGRVKVCGEFINSNQGSLIHWTHYDPGARHPDGFIALDGEVYGQTEVR